MEILFDNPLATMYGPYFLILYGFVIFFTVVLLALVKTQFDRTDKLTVPSIPSQIDPYEIAYLRGGPSELARAAIFGLLQKGFAEIDSMGSKTFLIKSQKPPAGVGPNQLERTVLEWLDVPASRPSVSATAHWCGRSIFTASNTARGSNGSSF